MRPDSSQITVLTLVILHRDHAVAPMTALSLPPTHRGGEGTIFQSLHLCVHNVCWKHACLHVGCHKFMFHKDQKQLSVTSSCQPCEPIGGFLPTFFYNHEELSLVGWSRAGLHDEVSLLVCLRST